VAVRWSCVEAGCHWAVTAADVDAVIPLVQAHISEIHSSFELEDMIEAVLEDVPGGNTGGADD